MATMPETIFANRWPGVSRRATRVEDRNETPRSMKGLLLETPAWEGIGTAENLPLIPPFQYVQLATLPVLISKPEPANRDDPHHAQSEARVSLLRDEAEAEGEPFDERSAAALLRFCHELAADARAAIFLLPNGNLRALWESAAGEQIGLQFLPDGLIQYVILQPGRRDLLKTLGVQEAAIIPGIVRALKLRHLWFRGRR